MKPSEYFLAAFMALILCCIIAFMVFPKFFSAPIEQHIAPNPQLKAFDSIVSELENIGWTSDAACLIASFEVDLLDESDTAEYELYKAYMED